MTNAPKQAGTRRSIVTTSGEREVRIERIFDAPRERVWRAMTEADLVAQWWGRGNPLTIETFEPKRGGHWRFVEHTDHGDFGFEGRFREVTRPVMIVRTFEWDGMPGHPCVETMTLEHLGDGTTRYVSVSLFMLGAERDGMLASGMEAGLNESHRALDRVLAAMT